MEGVLFGQALLFGRVGSQLTCFYVNDSQIYRSSEFRKVFGRDSVDAASFGDEQMDAGA
jgi:hypothetical protein